MFEKIFLDSARFDRFSSSRHNTFTLSVIIILYYYSRVHYRWYLMGNSPQRINRTKKSVVPTLEKNNHVRIKYYAVAVEG